jgi:large subunit ribosomal protein L25
VTVSATPDKLPENVEVDVTSLEIGQSITVEDIPTSDEYTIVTNPEEQIAAVNEAQVVEDEEPGEAAEPEVIGEEEE